MHKYIFVTGFLLSCFFASAQSKRIVNFLYNLHTRNAYTISPFFNKEANKENGIL